MSKKLIEMIEIDCSSCPCSPSRSVPCLRDRDEMKKFEETEDCFILEFDPDAELDFSKLSISEKNAEADLLVVAEKGQVACRDFPHPRHVCARFPFRTTPHNSHCKLCYCYVCDLPAPCKNWVGNYNHCVAFDNERWNTIRKLTRQGKELQKKEACRPHRRHACAKFPFRSTLHQRHCELCYCYVCEAPAPCEKWFGIGNFSHCHAFSDERWSRKRTMKRLARELQNKQKEPLSRADVTATQEEESNNPVLLQDQQQEEQVQPNLSVEAETDELYETKETTIYVGNLPYDVDSQKLSKIFQKFCTVKISKVIYERDTHQSRGFAFVTVTGVEEAENVIKMYNGCYLYDSRLTVSKAAKIYLSNPGVYYFSKIYVDNLSWSVDEERLEGIFREHGCDVGYEVVSVEIVFDRVTGKSRGFGYVGVKSRESGMEVVIVAELYGLILNGRGIRVFVANGD